MPEKLPALYRNKAEMSNLLSVNTHTYNRKRDTVTHLLHDWDNTDTVQLDLWSPGGVWMTLVRSAISWIHANTAHSSRSRAPWVRGSLGHLPCALPSGETCQMFRLSSGTGYGCPGIQGSYREKYKKLPAVPGLGRLDDNVTTAFPKSWWMEKGCFIEDTAANLAAHQRLNPSLSSEVSFQTYC